MHFLFNSKASGLFFLLRENGESNSRPAGCTATALPLCYAHVLIKDKWETRGRSPPGVEFFYMVHYDGYPDCLALSRGLVLSIFYRLISWLNISGASCLCWGSFFLVRWPTCVVRKWCSSYQKCKRDPCLSLINLGLLAGQSQRCTRLGLAGPNHMYSTMACLTRSLTIPDEYT